MMFLKAMVFALILTGCIITPFAARADDVSVAAAASLTYAMRDISEQFRRISGHRIQLTFGSSRNLMRQIIQGAPFEVFLSADQASVDRLVARLLTKGKGVIYALGRLVVFKPTRSRVYLTADLGFLPQVIDNGDLKRLAIANPDKMALSVAPVIDFFIRIFSQSQHDTQKGRQQDGGAGRTERGDSGRGGTSLRSRAVAQGGGVLRANQDQGSRTGTATGRNNVW